MNKLENIKKELQDLDYLVKQLMANVSKQRVILNAYHTKFGNVNIYLDEAIKDSEDFFLTPADPITICKKIDSEKIGIKTDYERILELAKKLGYE